MLLHDGIRPKQHAVGGWLRPEWLPLLILFFLCIASAIHPTAAKKARSGKPVPANELILTLHTAAQRRGLDLMRLDDEKVEQLITRPAERNYSLVLFFSTNDPNCGPCRHVARLLRMVKQAYDERPVTDHRTPRVFFAELWPQTSPSAIKTFSVGGVPEVMFVRSGDVWADAQLPVSTASFSDLADPTRLASWLSRMTGEKIKAPRQHWLVENAAPMVIVVVCALFFLYNRLALMSILRMPMFWFFITLWVYGFTMSGMHWNMLRGAPFVGISHAGGLQLFRAGHAQTIFEGLLMAVLFIGGGFTWIGITVRVPRERDPGKRVMQFCFMALTWTLIFCWTVAIYTAAKNRGYQPISYAIFK